MKKIKFQGKVPVDEHFRIKKSNFHVFDQGGKVYSATLNQTSVENNNNKFYILQVIQNSSKPN